MHHPTYTPGQGHPIQPDLHQLPPHQPPYSQHTMQTLPPMPPLSTGYADNSQMGAPPPAPLGPSDGTPGSAQDRAPLTTDQKKQQEQNLKPYSSSDGSGRMYRYEQFFRFIVFSDPMNGEPSCRCLEYSTKPKHTLSPKPHIRARCGCCTTTRLSGIH